MTGPPGFVDAVTGRIGAYTWNLIETYPVHLRVQEFVGDSIRAVGFSGKSGMRPRSLPTRPTSGTVHAERLFTVEVALLDHGVPVLGVALREVEHLGVDRAALDRLGLVSGPWLRGFKDAARRREPEDLPVRAETTEGGVRTFTLGELAAEVLRRGPGQTVAYVTDVAFTPENVERIVALAGGADLLVLEAAFLEEDAVLARERNHLTARQAGEIARATGAQRLAPFHLSPRYKGREDEVFREAEEAFGGPVLRLPTERNGDSNRIGSRG